jgi:muconolactone D-isomerase
LPGVQPPVPGLVHSRIALNDTKAGRFILERVRATELREQGVLRRLWRVPGRRAVVGLWEAADATILHEALASLPMFPWMDVTVEALATHPQEQK